MRRDYHEYRPHNSLHGLTLKEVESRYAKDPKNSTIEVPKEFEDLLQFHFIVNRGYLQISN
jgi:hypothetical protein